MDKLPDDSDIPNLSEALDKLLVDYTNHAELQQCTFGYFYFAGGLKVEHR